MSSGSDSLRGADTISDSEAYERLDYLAFLADTSDLSESDRLYWAGEIEEYNALAELVREVGTNAGILVSENHWRE